MPKYSANTAKPAPLKDSDFTEGAKSFFEIPIDKNLMIGFLKDPFEQRKTNANYYADHTASIMPGFKKAYAHALVSQIVKGAATDNRIKFAASENNLSLADFINAQTVLNDQEIGRENRYALIPSSKEADLFKIKEFVSIDYMDKKAIPTGAIGRIMGFWIIPFGTPKVNATGTISGTASQNTKEACVFGHKYGAGYGIDSFVNLTEASDPKTGKTQMSAGTRSGYATAFNTYSVVIYDN